MKLAIFYATEGISYDCYSTLEEALVYYGIIDDVSNEYDITDLKTYLNDSYFPKDINESSVADIKEVITNICTLDISYTENVENDPTHEYTNMVANVNKYGGFYIGRYEAGSQTIRTNTSGVTTMVVRQGAYPYNWVKWGESDTVIGETGAVYLSRNMYTDSDTYGVISTLCYGVQWDATLRFIKDKVDVTNSTAWGNYKNNTFDFTGEYTAPPYDANSWDDDETEKPADSAWLLTTGASEKNQAKNIYDLAGNVDEWTMENYGYPDCVVRGGDCSESGIGGYSASYRSGGCSITFSSNYIGFRPALYVK